MDIRQVVAQNIRFIREKRELSQEALAGKAKIAVSYIGYIERAERSITVVKLADIARVLKVPPSLLLEKDAYRRI